MPRRRRARHLVGLSLGGFVAQEVAILRPERVASLTLMSTSPDPTDPALPEPRVGRLALRAIRGLPLLKYRLLGGERNLVKERIAKTISVNGPDGIDVAETAELVIYDLRERRGVNVKALLQHQAAVAATRSRTSALKELHVPTLVVHGTADDVVPIEHGRRLATLIPDAAHLWLEGVGHVFPYPAQAGRRAANRRAPRCGGRGRARSRRPGRTVRSARRYAHLSGSRRDDAHDSTSVAKVSQPILVFNVPAHGHVNPTLPVVRELSARGHRVVYYDAEEFRGKIEAAGVEFRPYPPRGFTADFAGRAGSLPGVSAFLLEQSLRLLPFAVEEIGRENPGLIVFDSIAIWGMQAARLCDVPSVASISTPVYDGVRGAVSLRDSLHLLRGALPALLPIVRRRRELIARFGSEVFPRRSIFPCLGDANLVYTSRAFQPDSPLVDDSFHFVGASIEDSTGHHEDLPAMDIDPDRPSGLPVARDGLPPGPRLLPGCVRCLLGPSRSIRRLGRR